MNECKVVLIELTDYGSDSSYVFRAETPPEQGQEIEIEATGNANPNATGRLRAVVLSILEDTISARRVVRG